MNKQEYQRCSIGLWDTSIPGIRFDEHGVSNYCRMQQSLMEQYPRGEKGLTDWETMVALMKRAGKGKPYDCIVGVSGGTDSSYLLHVCAEYGLRVLAVNLDNGWSSDIAVGNIKKVTKALNFDLETYVIDYEEVKAVLRSYIKARLPWIDAPTDMAIKISLYLIAARENVKFVLNGSDFRSEGKQPIAWTYSDTKQLKFLVDKFEGTKLRSFPTQMMKSFFIYGFLYRIKVIRPLYFLPYRKDQARELLIKQYDWKDYGGHHHENIFTKFTVTYWLPVKFGIDKRIITYSAQILSGEITREEALKKISESAWDKNTTEKDIAYLLKKLDLSRETFDEAFTGDNRFFYNYPSYYPLIKKFAKAGKVVSGKIFGFKPGIFEAMDQKI